MSYTILIGNTVNTGGGSGGSSGGSSSGRDQSRMIGNDLTSRQANDNPLLKHTTVSGGLLIQNIQHAHTTKQAKTVMAFRPSSSNPNSGVRFSSEFTLALGEGSYCRAIVKLIDLGSEGENDTHDFYLGWNSTVGNKSVGNAGLYLRINNGNIFARRRAGDAGLATDFTGEAFSSYGTWLDIEMEYTADDECTITVKDLADGSTLHTLVVDEVPFYTNQESGELCYFQTHALKTTTGTVDHVVFDYVGFYAG
jgi:hypothetical protein